MSLILAFDDEAGLGRALAAALGWGFATVARHAFPDGETRLTLPAELPKRTVLLRGLQQPNAKLAELLLAAGGARELGAERLELVAPYLAYQRQDIAFSPGEVVSQRQLGRVLAAAFDAVVTVDPHLHRIASLAEVLPGRRGVALSAAELLGRFVAARLPQAVLVGPDAESGQWVRRAAQAARGLPGVAPAGLDFAICSKQRHGDREVAVTLPDGTVPGALRGRAVVLLDDVASTGRTLVEAARAVRAAGAASVDVAVTHALFVGDALAQVRAAGVREVWSSDCVPHPSNAVSVVPLVASALRELAAPAG